MVKSKILVASVAGLIVAAAGFALADSSDDHRWHHGHSGWMHGPGGMHGPGYGMMGSGPGYGMMGYGPGMMGYGGGPMMSGRAPMIDRNGNGLIDAGEAASHFEDIFVAMDQEGDGVLTSDEFANGAFGMAQPWNENARARRQENRKRRFAAIDGDKDGKITQSEFMAHGKQRFEAADKDKDGKVTEWEFRANPRF